MARIARKKAIWHCKCDMADAKSHEKCPFGCDLTPRWWEFAKEIQDDGSLEVYHPSPVDVRSAANSAQVKWNFLWQMTVLVFSKWEEQRCPRHIWQPFKKTSVTTAFYGWINSTTRHQCIVSFFSFLHLFWLFIAITWIHDLFSCLLSAVDLSATQLGCAMYFQFFIKLTTVCLLPELSAELSAELSTELSTELYGFFLSNWQLFVFY